MFFNEMIPFSLSLINWNSDILVEFALLTNDHLLNGLPHLLH